MTMNVRTIRERLHDYVAAMPDEKLTALYTVLQQDVDALARQNGKEEDISEEALENLHRQYREEFPEKVVCVSDDGSYPPGFFEELDLRRANYYADKSTAISAEESKRRIREMIDNAKAKANTH